MSLFKLDNAWLKNEVVGVTVRIPLSPAVHSVTENMHSLIAKAWGLLEFCILMVLTVSVLLKYLKFCRFDFYSQKHPLSSVE